MPFKYLDKLQDGGHRGASEHQASHRADLCNQVWLRILWADVCMGSEPSVLPAHGSLPAPGPPHLPEETINSKWVTLREDYNQSGSPLQIREMKQVNTLCEEAQDEGVRD